jgi:hypothetical protein
MRGSKQADFNRRSDGSFRWDMAVADSNGGRSDALCRIYRDLASEEWLVEGIYD